jgi:hypothetical protein
MDQESATLAFQIASQLPEDFDQAGNVLKYLDELRHWRAGKGFPQAGKSEFSKFDVNDSQVVALPRRGGAAVTPNLRRRGVESPLVLPK